MLERRKLAKRNYRKSAKNNTRGDNRGKKLGWVGHVVSIQEDGITKKVFEVKIPEKKGRRRLRHDWEEEIVNHVGKSEVNFNGHGRLIEI